jgi:uncharacterized membrane protein (Fun14 family)
MILQLTDPDGGGIVTPITRYPLKNKLLNLFALTIGLLVFSAPILAHHGSSAYESKKMTTLKGTVTDFQFMNPHTEIVFEVKGDSGKVEKWTAEGASLLSMR